MIEAVPEPSPAIARKVFVRQMTILAGLLALSALANGYSVFADRARSADPLPLWKPMVWEFSSHVLIWLLVPAVGRWLAHFPLSRAASWRSIPAHLAATLPFSVLHTGGMVGLRKLAYAAVGDRYDFGPFWSNWLYEYRKDCFAYCVVVAAVLAFRVYGLWLDARAHASGEPAAGAATDARHDDAASPGETASRFGKLVVRKRNREFILDSSEIDRLEADGNYVWVHAAGQSYRLRDSLEGVARRLGEQRFARVHRTHVVNIESIREVQPWDHGDYRILLKDGTFVNFSRRYRSRLSHLFR